MGQSGQSGQPGEQSGESDEAEDGTAPERRMGDRIASFVLAGFGSGYSSFAPGTCGTLVAVVILIAFSRTGLPAQPTILALAAAATLLCLVLGTRVERTLAAKDPQSVVMDEFAGYFVAVALPGAAWPTLRELFVAFLLFRLFDIIKPPPARRLQTLQGGVGIVIDDLIAGLYALGGLYVFRDMLMRPH